MSDTPTSPAPVHVTPGGPVTPGGAPAPGPIASEPAADEPAADAGADPLADMTPEQIDALASRIEQARANRPPSLADALTKLQENLTAAHRDKDDAVATRKAASAEADAAAAAISEVHQTLRRMQMAEAATAAGFKDPAQVAAMLAGQEGDPLELVTKAAASGVFAMKTPAPSAQVGGPNSQTPTGLDPGLAAMVAEINAAHGR